MSKGTDSHGRSWESLREAYDKARREHLMDFEFIKARKNLLECEAHTAQQQRAEITEELIEKVKRDFYESPAAEPECIVYKGTLYRKGDKIPDELRQAIKKERQNG